MTATKAPHVSPPISPWVMVCPDCGKPMYRVHEVKDGRNRMHDYCPADMFDHGYDAAIRRDDFEYAQARKRRESGEAA